ncbi:cdc42 effector protein 1b [Thalassophryne amazonica]|uniref:cdc42 effector protein 1b n=1 Tax=Thalassophryne amazonica TaxID=390379 RepID=UPI0014711B24|nr:cdc42 effector protein 1b [Thalassophryne amazonica]
MSMGKLPGIKGLVSGSQGKRRFKSDLSVDMISLPLGDFRHTMHVGRGGEVFGDTSFLSNYGGMREPGSPDSADSSKTTGFFTRTFRHIRRESAPRPRQGSRDLSSPPPDISPIIKNAISLPHLSTDPPNGCLQRMLFPSSISSTDESFCTYGLHSGFVTLPRLSRYDRQFPDGDIQRGSDSGDVTWKRSDSLTSFTLDLGPSLMTEVLSLIDNPSCFQMSNHNQKADEEGDEEDEEEEESGSVTNTTVQSPGVSSLDPSTGSEMFVWNMNSRGPCGTSCTRTHQEEDIWSLRTPDASLGSPQRAEPVIDAERFQKAADVLSRHYGGGSVRKRTNSNSPAFSSSHETGSTLSEEEEEIKL